jgi:WD40 repeat protein
MILNDGTVITGAATGQEALAVRPGESADAVDLSRAKDVTVTCVDERRFVEYTLVVLEGDREIFRTSRQVDAALPNPRMAEVARKTGHTRTVQAVVPSPDGRCLLSASRERIVLWDRAMRSSRVIDCDFGEGSSVAFSPDGCSLLSTAGFGWTLIDAKTGAPRVSNASLGEPLHCAAVSPDGKLVYTSSWGRYFTGGIDKNDSMIRVWEVAGQRVLRRLSLLPGVISSIAVSSDGRHLLAGGNHRNPLLVQTDYAVPPRDSLFGHTDRINSVAFLPYGNRAVSGSADRTIRLWDLFQPREIHCFRGHQDAVFWVAVSPNGRRMLSSSLAGKELLLWNLESPFELIARVAWGDACPTRGAFTLDGLEAAWGATDGSVRLYEFIHLD